MIKLTTFKKQVLLNLSSDKQPTWNGKPIAEIDFNTFKNAAFVQVLLEETNEIITVNVSEIEYKENTLIEGQTNS